MHKLLQWVLLTGGIVALAALLADIVLSLVATTHGSTPVRTMDVQAGPYPLTVSLYKNPANAGYALPFAITAPQLLTYAVTSVPGRGVDATAIRASISPDTTNTHSVQGVAEITVRGHWQLHIVVRGKEGQGIVDIPVTAIVPQTIPVWLGWWIGSLPLVGLFFFLLMQSKRRRQPVTEQQPNQE
jgi:hypothetical protein